MKDNKLVFLSALLLSSSIMFSSIYLGNSIKQAFTPVSTDVIAKPISSPDLLTKAEAAAYLNLSESMFNIVLKQEAKENIGNRSHTTYRYIHSLDLYGQIFFSRKQLDEWIEYHIYNKY